MNILTLSNICVSQQQRNILLDITLSVAEAEVSVLIGENASGKTTALKTISGLIMPDSGTIRFQDQDVTTTPAHLRARDGLLFCQAERQLFQQMTVLENLEFGHRLLRDKTKYSFSRAMKRIIYYFPLLKGKMAQKAGSLSGGEQKLVAIARAFLVEPTVLLLDEPMLGLSGIHAESLVSIISDFCNKGSSILLTEQSPNLALRVKGRIYLMERGKLIQEY